MKILLLGSGGREHAFPWKLRQSALCQALFIAPGNAGTAALGINLSLNPLDFPALGDVCLREGIDMVIVGPEEPLVKGVVDYFRNHPSLQHILMVGPSAAGAQLEGSKAFAKAFMEEFDIPTAAYREFTAEQMEEGLAYLATQPLPIVLKADGLAAGKGVLICQDSIEAQQAFREMLGGKFGDAGKRVVVEAFLDGIEFSVFVLTDGKDYCVLPVAKDYKRIGEGDTGLNTGGMGAVSPVPFVDDAMMQMVTDRIILPTIRGLQERQLNYKGFIFLGLIRVNGEPFVIEYNCRMGDPETEVVFPRLQNDLVAMMAATARGQLANYRIQEDPRTATTLVLVSGGYPGDYEKGKVISGLTANTSAYVFHSGTQQNGENVVTNGGRVLAITGMGADIPSALQVSRDTAAGIHFEGMYFRRDIGQDLL